MSMDPARYIEVMTHWLAKFTSGPHSPMMGVEASVLRGIKVPTLVLHGEGDPLIPVECGRDVARLVPGAEIETIAGWGHDFPPQLVPRLVDRISGFCRGK